MVELAVVPGLLGSRQSPSPFLLLALLSSQGPYPPPALPRFPGTTGASPPPQTARPVLRRLPVGTCHATAGASPCCVHPPPPCVPSPLPRRNRPVLASLASQPVPAFPVLPTGRLPHHPFRACSAFTHVAARMIAESPSRPVSSQCFSPRRYLHRPLRLLPAGATVSGGIRTR